MRSGNSQQQQQPECEESDSEEEERRSEARDQLRADKKTLSTTYKFLGGKRSGLLRIHKIELIEHISSGELTAPMMVQFSDCLLDKVMFVLTGLPLSTKLSDLRCKSKHDLREKLGKEVNRLGRRATCLEFNAAVRY
jgi:hypothetical protein